MEKRISALFSFFAVGVLIVIISLYNAAFQKQYEESAQNQSTYILQVASGRGTIYDTNLCPITNASSKVIAAVAPCNTSAQRLTELLPSDVLEDSYHLLSNGTPFLLTLQEKALGSDTDGLDIFKVKERYGESLCAAHVVGYTDAQGNGISGMEEVFDDVLSKYSGNISVRYRVDAVNRVLSVAQREIESDYEKTVGGVVLTIDKEIQKIAEDAAKTLKKGAVIVTEVKSGKIRALVSKPDFSPETLAEVLDSEDAPLLNRNLCAYNVGSVFKLVSAAAALENKILPSFSYTCKGSYDVSGMQMHCYNSIAHGSLTMESAIAYSCNGYFIKLMQEVPTKQFLSMAEQLGFGETVHLLPQYESSPGLLPTEEELKLPRALANFSFGQGTLCATPLHIAMLIGTIANQGVRQDLSIFEGTLDEQQRWIEVESPKPSKRVMQAETAAQLCAFMQAAVEYGTASEGGSEKISSAAKTATAQTGIYIEGKEAVNMWYAGFFPAETPKYTVVVLADGEVSSKSPCTDIFKKIMEQCA